MFQPHAIAIFLTGLCMALSTHAALPVHKCVVNGAVSFQHEPCQADLNRAPPKTTQTNVERPKPNAAQGVASPQPEPTKPRAAASTQPSTPAPTSPVNLPTQRGADRQPAAVPGLPSPSAGSSFRCDSRQYCSQMTSCAEAKYFLANCAATKMDGNRDGVPCEMQWCH